MSQLQHYMIGILIGAVFCNAYSVYFYKKRKRLKKNKTLTLNVSSGSKTGENKE